MSGFCWLSLHFSPLQWETIWHKICHFLTNCVVALQCNMLHTIQQVLWKITLFYLLSCNKMSLWYITVFLLIMISTHSLFVRWVIYYNAAVQCTCTLHPWNCCIERFQTLFNWVCGPKQTSLLTIRYGWPCTTCLSDRHQQHLLFYRSDAILINAGGVKDFSMSCGNGS